MKVSLGPSYNFDIYSGAFPRMYKENLMRYITDGPF